MSDLPFDTDVKTVKQMLDDGTPFILIDVREQDEYDFAKIEGSRLVPMSMLKESIGDLQQHKSEHIVMHCHHGGRSARTTQFLKDEGFEKVQNLAGGIHAWSEEIDPEVPVY